MELLSLSDQSVILVGSSNQYSFKSGISSNSTIEVNVCSEIVFGVIPQK